MSSGTNIKPVNFDSAWDRPAYTETANYFICTTPRTGSNLLMFALQEQGLGLPMEYFNTKIPKMALFAERNGIDNFNNLQQSAAMRQNNHCDYQRYSKILQSCRRTKNGIFGAKIFADSLLWGAESFQYLLDSFYPVV